MDIAIALRRCRRKRIAKPRLHITAIPVLRSGSLQLLTRNFARRLPSCDMAPGKTSNKAKSKHDNDLPNKGILVLYILVAISDLGSYRVLVAIPPQMRSTVGKDRVSPSTTSLRTERPILHSCETIHNEQMATHHHDISQPMPPAALKNPVSRPVSR